MMFISTRCCGTLAPLTRFVARPGYLARLARAVNQVARELGEQADVRQVPPHPRAGESREPRRGQAKHHGRWHSRVRDIMTTQIVAVDRITPFKQIAWQLVHHQIDASPVLSLGRHVAGVVTEGDLIAARDKHAGQRRRWTDRRATVPIAAATTG